MTPPPPSSATRTRDEKYEERRTQLAISALATLGELGYARTSLREIAQNSEFSHGVVHYYFNDKVALITHCVRYYKTQCATRYDQIVETAATAEELREGFAAKLRETLVEEAPMHRLWYDLRAQGLFEVTLRDDVLAIDDLLEKMIWRVISRYAELANAQVSFDSTTCYTMLDGIFQKAVLRHFAGDTDAGTDLVQRVEAVLPLLITQH